MEDLQTLANQGILPEGVLGEEFDFIPIPEADSPTETVPPTTAAQITTPSVEMAPPKAPISVMSKRKASSEESPSDATKKPRRTAKSRQAKRSKI